MVHGETYSKLIDKYIRDASEKKKAYSKPSRRYPPLKDKADWAMKWFDNAIDRFESAFWRSRVLKVYSFPGVSVLYSGSRKRGMLPGLCFSNELISRDEGLHLEFAIELI